MSPAEVKESWGRIKAEEKAERDAHRGETPTSLLASVKAGQPALAHALALQEKASTVGFDWNDPRAVLAKIREEADEIEAALDGGDAGEVAAETGDLLFAVINLARHAKAGTVWLNTFGYTDVRLPWGGAHDSGLGRERGTAALKNFTEEKVVWLNTRG